MGKRKNYIQNGNSVIFYKSSYPKPKNFIKHKIFGDIFCSYDIPIYSDKSIGTLDIINLNIPYEIDIESGIININENVVKYYIQSIIGVDLEECNVFYFKRDGAFFPFVHDISIYDKQVEKYFDNKKLRFRKYKIDKLRINVNKTKHKIC